MGCLVICFTTMEGLSYRNSGIVLQPRKNCLTAVEGLSYYDEGTVLHNHGGIVLQPWGESRRRWVRCTQRSVWYTRKQITGHSTTLISAAVTRLQLVFE